MIALKGDSKGDKPANHNMLLVYLLDSVATVILYVLFIL